MPNPNSHANALPPQELERLAALFKAGRLAEAESGALRAVERHPQAGKAWSLLGVVQQLQGKDAMHAMREAARLLPGDARAQSNLGACLIALERYTEALPYLRRAAELAPQLADAHNNLGLALKETGEADAAMQSLRRALQVQPGFMRALNNLGNLLADLGHYDEAESCLRQAVASNPGTPELHYSLGNLLRRRERPAEAAACFREALRLLPGYAEALTSLGMLLHELGQRGEAQACLRRAVESKPGYAEAWCALGDLLRDEGRPHEALGCLQRAVQQKPRLGSAHLSLVAVWRELNRADEAAAACALARQYEPNRSEPLVMQGVLHADAGAFDAAEEAFRAAIAQDRDCATAWAGLTRLRKMGRDDGDWLAEASRIVETKPASRQEVHLQYALGKYHDDVGEYDTAFAHYRRANELARTLGKPYDRAREEERLAAQLREQDAAWLAGLARAGNDSARPLFIVGMPRSGTSLAEQILAAHPAVHGAGELGFWEVAAPRFAGKDFSQAAQLLHETGKGYLELLQSFSADALHVTDKMPANFRHLSLIHAAFPRARIVHMRRNPIDICLSIYFRQFGTGMNYANDLDDLAHYYRTYERLMAHWRSLLPPGTLLDVPYEELVREQEPWTRKILDFAALPWDARCLEFHRAERSVTTASNWQVRQKMNAGSVERWRHYEAFVEPLLGLLAKPY